MCLKFHVFIFFILYWLIGYVSPMSLEQKGRSKATVSVFLMHLGKRFEQHHSTLLLHSKAVLPPECL